MNAYEEVLEWEKTEAVGTLKECGLLPNMLAMDFGCGYGHYTVPASIVVGESGKVLAIDRDKFAIEEVIKKLGQCNIENVLVLHTNESILSEYENSVDFLMYYDIFHALKPNKNENLQANRELISKFHKSLNINGIFSFAVFSEIELVQDPVNGPKTPKGKPAWFRIPYDDALEYYGVITLIESCGFKLHNVVKNKGIHFDDFHNESKWKKYGEVRLFSLECKDIYNFLKV